MPAWIRSVDIANGVILISGKLHEKDVGAYILKIFDSQNFTIKSIKILIES